MFNLKYSVLSALLPTLRSAPTISWRSCARSLCLPTPREYSAMAQAIEEAKRLAAQAAVRDHFPKPPPKYVGIGSGTTIIYVVEAIRDLGVDLSDTHFIPTGFQSRQLIMKAGLKVQAYNNLRNVDSIQIAFDGADEVDEDLNCIKGGGACLFQEKLVAMRAEQFVCVAGECLGPRFEGSLLTLRRP